MNLLRNRKQIAFYALFILILLGTTWFFYGELKSHWESLRWADLRLRPPGILIAFVLVAAAYFLATVVWYYGVHAHPSGRRVSLMESYAVVNTTQMTKYLPGKIWSYTLQTILMRRKGVSTSYLLYLNLLIALSLVFSASLFGTLFLMAYSRRVPGVLSFLVFLAVSAAYIGFIFLNGRVFRGMVQVVNRFTGKDIVFFELPLVFLLKMQAALVLSNALFGLAGYAACYGIGCDIPAEMAFPVSAATLFSDMLGFVMFLSPGGLGIREGAMLFLLDGITGKRIALLLPVALRIITMASDLILGLSGFVLLRKYAGKWENSPRCGRQESMTQAIQGPASGSAPCRDLKE
jgi:uncharacterized membrane protein YbhN (UPF0104 family)